MTKLLGVEIGEDGPTAWRKNGDAIERRCLYNGSAKWESVAVLPCTPKTAEELRKFCNDGGFTYAEKAVARIFQEPTGKWHICDDALPYLDARGSGYDTKAQAIRAAAFYYTHAIGSGCYWEGVRSLAPYLH